MFWQAVIEGLAVFLHWETYAVAVIFFLITFLPFVIISMAAENNDDLLMKSGCVMALAQPLLLSVAVFISVSILYPIMLGGSEAAWTFPFVLMSGEPIRVLIILGIMLGLAFVGGFMPILGRSNSFIMFIMGGVVLVHITMIIHRLNPELGINNIELIPGWLTIIGIVLASGISAWLGILAVAAVMTLILRDKEDLSQFIMMPLGSLFGFIPIFIYAAWIGLQIKAQN